MLALGEIGSMALGAARGAGIPLGQAEDLARTAVYLAATGQDIGPVTKALREPRTDVRLTWTGTSVVVHQGSAALVGPVIRDAFVMGSNSATLACPAQVPFVAAMLAEHGIGAGSSGARIARCDTETATAGHGPVAIDAADWAIWSDLAALTYVPESDASRSAGAGAGLDDND